MPIDPAGTAPGLPVPTPPQPKQHHMKCRRDGCDSVLAIEITPPGMSNHLYQCVTCKTTLGVTTGGSVNF